MDMTTCDRISASSAFIRAAIEATASEHSSWKEFNQTQTSLNQPSLSKASRPSFAFSFLTRETGRGWLPGCSSPKTSPPDQLCSHSDRENTWSNKILNLWRLPFYVSYLFHSCVGDKLEASSPTLLMLEVMWETSCWTVAATSASSSARIAWTSHFKSSPHRLKSALQWEMCRQNIEIFNTQHNVGSVWQYFRLTSLAMDSLALLTSSPSFLLRSFPFSFRTSNYFSTWTQGRDGHQPEVQAALELLQALSPGFKMSFWHNWCFIKNATFEKSCLAQMKSPAKQRQAPRKAK